MPHFASGFCVAFPVKCQDTIRSQHFRRDEGLFTKQVEHLNIVEPRHRPKGPSRDGANMLFKLSCRTSFRGPVA